MSVQFDFSEEMLHRRLDDALEGAIADTLEVVKEDVEPFVPYDTGELSNSAVIDESSGSLVWEAEYAEYVYDMPEHSNFNTDVHPWATSHWVDEALHSYRKKWVDEFKRKFGRRW